MPPTMDEVRNTPVPITLEESVHADRTGKVQLNCATFIDGLPEVFERAAKFLRDEVQNEGFSNPEIESVTLNLNEDGDYILNLYYDD